MIRLASCIAFAALASSAFGQAPPPTPTDGSKFPWPAQTGSGEQPAAAPATVGTIAIKVTQGTPGEPPIGVIPVEVQLFHRGMLLDTIKTETDEHGVALIDQISIAMPVQPLVKVNFDKLDYQVGGGMLDAEHPRQDIEVVCFASTDVPPAWKISMRHLMAVPEAGGLRVTEMMVVENPGQRTWIGRKEGGPKLVTTSFPLPADAKDVQLGRGFHKWCCSTLINGSLVNHLPLMPEASEMTYSYLMPAKNGVVALDLTAPATVESTMVVLPSMLHAETLTGLSFGGEQSMGEGTVGVYMAAAMNAGQKATMSIGGVPEMAPGSAMPAATGPSAQPATPKAAQTQSPAGADMAKLIAGIGGVLILVIGGTVLLRKSGSTTTHAA